MEQICLHLVVCLIVGDLEPVTEGDEVLVTATPAELEELHKRRGLWDPEMANVSISLYSLVFKIVNNCWRDWDF